MLCITNTSAATPRGSTEYGYVAPILTGDENYIFPWLATGRNQFGPKYATPTRSATACYMRGLKEVVQVQTNNGTPWQWRRICVQLKANVIYGSNFPDLRFWDNGGNGVHRVVNNTDQLGPASVLLDFLFRGTQGIDWSDTFSAPVDTTRVTLAYDRTKRLTSGNQYGMMKSFKMWHPMNKTLVYDDEEDGGTMIPSALSVADKRGMGDYFIVDFIRAGTGGTDADRMSWHPNATLYWHEK